MSFLFIQSWLPESVAKAIGWTLVHSLWQGLLLTFVAGILIMLTRRSASAIRYRLLSVLLIAFITTSCITFILELQTPAAPSAIEVLEAELDRNDVLLDQQFLQGSLIQTSNIQPPTSFFDEFTKYVNTHAPLIVTIWLMIFLFKCLRLTAHIGYARRLRYHKSTALPALQKRVEELAMLMKIKATVLIRESSIIKTPSVIGFLKPVILLPLGLLSNLPPDQVEAIILHELAHIRRKDYLVNILQCFAETIFFFNPSVLWLSSLIRQERENCCDDMAIGVIGKKSTYIHALVAFQEYNLPSNYAPAFAGEKYPVLQRVKRIVHNNNKNLSNMEKIILAAGLLLSTVLIFAFSSTSAQQTATVIQPINQTEIKSVTPVQNIISVPVALKDTPIEKTKQQDITGAITTYDSGKEYTIILKNSKIKGLFIDNEKVADEEIDNHKEAIDRIIKRESEKRQRKKSVPVETGPVEMAKQPKKVNIANEADSSSHSFKYQGDNTKFKTDSKEFKLKPGDNWGSSVQMSKSRTQRSVMLYSNSAEKDGGDKFKKVLQVQAQQKEKQAEADVIQLEKLIHQYQEKWKKEDINPADLDSIFNKYKKYRNVSNEPTHKKASAKPPSKPKNTKNADMLVNPDQPRSATKKLEQLRDRIKDEKEFEKRKKNILNDVIGHKLLPDDKFLMIELNTREMRINGSKVSGEIHDLFNKKYLRGYSDRISFTYDAQM